MPAAERALAASGLRAEQIEPSGPGGSVLKEDVLKGSSQETEARSQESRIRSQKPEVRGQEQEPATPLEAGFAGGREE